MGFSKVFGSEKRTTGVVLHAEVVLVTVAASGVGLAFAAVGLVRGAKAFGGVGRRQDSEGDKRGQRGEEAAAER